ETWTFFTSDREQPAASPRSKASTIQRRAERVTGITPKKTSRTNPARRGARNSEREMRYNKPDAPRLSPRAPSSGPRAGGGSLVPVGAGDQAVVGVGDDLPGRRADRGRHHPHAAVAQAGGHEVPVQALHAAVVAAGGDDVALDAARVGHAEEALAEVGV